MCKILNLSTTGNTHMNTQHTYIPHTIHKLAQIHHIYNHLHMHIQQTHVQDTQHTDAAHKHTTHTQDISILYIHTHSIYI